MRMSLEVREIPSCHNHLHLCSHCHICYHLNQPHHYLHPHNYQPPHPHHCLQSYSPLHPHHNSQSHPDGTQHGMLVVVDIQMHGGHQMQDNQTINGVQLDVIIDH